MADILASSLQSDLRCDASVAERIATLARQTIPEITTAADDTDEDLLVRIRDPLVFGEFAYAVIREEGLPIEARVAVAENAFDLLPLPRGETDVILVERRAPPHLLEIASFLGRTDALTVLHIMHLVFAIFLDRRLIRDATRATRSEVLGHVLGHEEAGDPLRALYAHLHLSTVPETEAHREFKRALRSAGPPRSLKRILATFGAASDGGIESFLRLARAEGLVPSDGQGAEDPEIVANVPRLPERLAAPARRWLARDARGG